jgi:hypothetical protein
VASGEDCFNEDGSGWTTSASPWALDLTSAPRAELLDNLGIPHEQVNDIGVGYLLEFRDPDNIALELFAPPGDPLPTAAAVIRVPSNHRDFPSLPSWSDEPPWAAAPRRPIEVLCTLKGP